MYKHLCLIIQQFIRASSLDDISVSRIHLIAGKGNLFLISLAVFSSLLCGFTSTNRANAQPVELQEILSIDGFLSIADVAVGDDGSIYVGDQRNVALSKHDSLGKLIRQVGGQGRAPGEFINGPHHLVLIENTLIVSDQKGDGVLHYFDPDLNYIGSAQISTLMDMDVASDKQLYLGITDNTTLSRYVSMYTPAEDQEIIFEIRDVYKHNLENYFLLLAGHPEKIIVVFQFVNRIDLYDLSGRILNRLSVSELSSRYQGRFMDMGKQSNLPDHIRESASYVPGGPMFTSAVLDHRGNLFLEHGDKIGDMPSRRSVYVMTLEGNEKGKLEMPPRTSLRYIDTTGYAYAAETMMESTMLKNIKSNI